MVYSVPQCNTQTSCNVAGQSCLLMCLLSKRHGWKALEEGR